MKTPLRLTAVLAVLGLCVGRCAAASSPAPEKTLSDLLWPVFSQARDRTVRVLIGGTSIASFGYSNNQIFVSQLKAIYGDARADVMRMGIVNGSWDIPALGWFKQPYSGPNFVRLRGDANSQPLVLTGYGSRIVVEYSNEANGGMVDVSIDDAPSGTINCGGTQALSLKSVIAIPEGLHRLTLKAPRGGYGYLERVTFEQNRPGVEIIDGTLGGSGLVDVFEAAPRGGQTVLGIPTQPGVGVRSYFGRPDIDFVIWSGPVNDSGGGNPDFATWSSRMNQVVEETRARKVQIATNGVGSVSTIITKAPHGLLTGDEVTISGVTGSKPTINGTRVVTVLSATSFSVPVAVSAAGKGGSMSKSGCPLLLIAEMGGHLSMPADPDHAAFQQKYEYLKQLGQDNDHVFTLDWHGATLDSDFVRYAAKYYTTGARVVVNPVTGVFSGDFIHPNATGHQVALEMLCQSMDVPTPPEASAANLDNRIRKSSPVAAGSRVRFLDGTLRRNMVVSGVGASVFGGLTYISTLPLVISQQTENLSDWNKQIAASTTSDRFGRYIDYGQDTGIPIFDRNVVGERVTVTALVKPTAPGIAIRLRSPSNSPGVMYYRDSVLPECSTILYDAAETPMWITFDYIRGEHTGMLMTGRLYGIYVTRTNGQPVSTELRGFSITADLQTLPATDVTSTGATVNATVRSGGQGVLSVSFDIGVNRNVSDSAASRNAIIADDGLVVGVDQPLTGLRPNTTYYYRVRATSAGNPISQTGEILKFRTPGKP